MPRTSTTPAGRRRTAARAHASALLWRNFERFRWTVIALLLGLALYGFITHEPVPSYRTATIAAADIDSGATIEADDLTEGSAAPGPATLAASQAVGEVARGPIGSGELLTASRIAPGRTVRLAPGLSAYPLPLPDPDLGTLLRAGDRVDLLATHRPDRMPWSDEPEAAPSGPIDATDPTGPTGSTAPSSVVIAENLEVLAVPKPDSDSGWGQSISFNLVLLATTRKQALALASQGKEGDLSIVIR